MLVELTVARQAEPLLVPGLSGSDDDIHVTPVRDPTVSVGDIKAFLGSPPGEAPPRDGHFGAPMEEKMGPLTVQKPQDLANHVGQDLARRTG